MYYVVLEIKNELEKWRSYISFLGGKWCEHGCTCAFSFFTPCPVQREYLPARCLSHFVATINETVDNNRDALQL